MPPSPVDPGSSGEDRSSDDDEARQRTRRVLLVLGGFGAVSAVVAGLVIFSSGSPKPPPEPAVAAVRVEGGSVSVGAEKAPTVVVVYEDFASPASRTFEISSRDFLRGEAARGEVLVQYHPIGLGAGYSSDAAAAWGGVVSSGTPEQALALHDLLFDRQPAANDPAPGEFIALAKKAGVTSAAVLEAVASPAPSFADASRAAAAGAGVRTTPTVLLDGKQVTAASAVDLADDLQRAVLGTEGQG